MNDHQNFPRDEDDGHFRGPFNYAPEPLPYEEDVRESNTHLIPVIALLSVILVALVGAIFWVLTSGGGSTDLEADGEPGVVSTEESTGETSGTDSDRTGSEGTGSGNPDNTTVVETTTITETGGTTQAQQTPASTTRVVIYGGGISDAVRCSNVTEARAIFRGTGGAECNFIALVGDRLAGSSVSGTNTVRVQSPNTGEMVTVTCSPEWDSSSERLWSCLTHHDSRLYVYP